MFPRSKIETYLPVMATKLPDVPEGDDAHRILPTGAEEKGRCAMADTGALGDLVGDFEAERVRWNFEQRVSEQMANDLRVTLDTWVDHMAGSFVLRFATEFLGVRQYVTDVAEEWRPVESRANLARLWLYHDLRKARMKWLRRLALKVRGGIEWESVVATAQASYVPNLCPHIALPPDKHYQFIRTL